MEPSIFGKELKDVKYADVVAFCNQKPKENLSLDYKKDLSSLPNIVKTLASFANTNGGWIVVGVEDENDCPKLPITGMTPGENFEQKINNSIISTVSPIALPFYKECVSDDGKNILLVIYMAQSHSAPHFMQYKGKNVLFVRLADRASGEEWENYATSSKWEMLRNRREASSNLRESLLSMMKEVYKARANAEDEEERHKQPATLLSVVPQAYIPGRHYLRTQTITILPAYPSTQVSDMASVRHMITNEPIGNGIANRRPQTPDHRGYDTKLYQAGAYAFHKDEPTHQYYFFGLDVHGNIMNVDPIELERVGSDNSGNKVKTRFTELSLVAMSIVGALLFAYKFYSKTGLAGSLIFRVEFSGSEGCMMFFPMTNPLWSSNEDNLPLNTTGYYMVQREIDTNILSNPSSFNNFVCEVIKEILYSFNYGTIDDKQLHELVKQARGSN